MNDVLRDTRVLGALFPDGVVRALAARCLEACRALTDRTRRRIATTRRRALVRALCAPVAVWLVLALGPARAYAYRTYSDDPEIAQPARLVGDVEWEIASPASASATELTAIEGATFRAMETWTGLECSGIRVQFAGGARSAARSGDGRNTVVFVAGDWAGLGLPDGRPATADVQLVQEDGVWRIAEADVFVDIVGWEWRELSGSASDLSLEAVLVHELGHFFGLLHPCEHEVGAAPLCSAEPMFVASVLHPDYGDLRPPSAEDVESFCRLYPRLPDRCIPECPPDQTCVAGACTPSCELETDGCSGSCGADDECASGACAVGGTDIGLCVPQGARGASCASGEECSSRVCLVGDHAPSYCTVGCDSDLACSEGERCRQIDGQRACAPPPSSQGCSVGVVPTRRHGAAQLALWWVALSSILVRRRNR